MWGDLWGITSIPHPWFYSAVTVRLLQSAEVPVTFLLVFVDDETGTHSSKKECAPSFQTLQKSFKLCLINCWICSNWQGPVYPDNKQWAKKWRILSAFIWGSWSKYSKLAQLSSAWWIEKVPINKSVLEPWVEYLCLLKCSI